MKVELTLIELNIMKLLLTEKAKEAQGLAGNHVDARFNAYSATLNVLLRKVKASMEE